MATPGELVMCFGTSEVIPVSRQIVVGDIAYQLNHDSIRHICWKGHEVIRAITWPIRDQDWGTMRPDIIAEDFSQSDTRSDYHLHFQVGDASLDCRVSIGAETSGELQAVIEMQANEEFLTNRAGFTVLHPIAGVAGTDLQVTHADGTVEHTQFPTLISPSQPVMDIVGLHHVLHGVDIDIRFDGEVFEMEDQRNWSDASYKTYCVPLVHPFTYTIESGVTVRQNVAVTLSGGEIFDKQNTDIPTMTLLEQDAVAPKIGLAIDNDWAVSSRTLELLARCRVQFILARLDLENNDMLENKDVLLDTLKNWSDNGEQEIDLELVLPDSAPLPVMTRLAQSLKDAGITPAHVIALPQAYLGSFQPSGPWPEGLTPVDTFQAAKTAFPDAAIGAGMLTNFTEFNRCRPDPIQCDYVTYGNTAIVHDADDRSVMQTLEALPQIFASTQALCKPVQCRLGLISIGARTNPYGSASVANPTQSRKALAEKDPRQRGLFAAAWTVGVLHATHSHPIEAITLAAPAGPFGIVWQLQDYPQTGFDDEADAALYPLFHVVCAVSAMSGCPRIKVGALPEGVVAYGVKAADEYQLILANTSKQPCTVSFCEFWHIRILDTHSFTNAVRDPDWLENSTVVRDNKLSLQAFATAFLILPGSAHDAN